MLGLGSNAFTWDGDFAPVVIDDLAIVAFSQTDGRLGLYLRLFDEQNRPLVLIEDSELLMRADNWDVQFEGQVLTIREGLGAVALRVRFQPPNFVDIERMNLWYNGVHVDVVPSNLTFRVGDSVHKYSASMFEMPIAIKAGNCPKFSTWPAYLTVRSIQRSGGFVVPVTSPDGKGTAEPRP